MRPLVVFAALGLTTAAPAGDADWPAWRGPTADGVAPASADPPVTWDATTNVRWKAPLPGRGSGTPVVWGEQVFVVTAARTDREAKPDERPKRDPKLEAKTDPPAHFYRFEVHSFDRQSGKPRWSRVAAEAVPHEGHHPTHSYAAGSPATDGKLLFVSFGSFGVYAFDLAGNPVWKRDLGRIQSRLGWGEAVTPVVHGGSVVLNWDQEGAGDSRLITLDAATGATRWEAKRDERTSWNTPLVVQHDGRTLVVVNGTNRARAYDLADGKEVWAVGGMTVNAIPSPVAAGGVAYIMSGYRGSAAVAVPLGSSGDLGAGPGLWRYGKGTPYVPSPLLYRGRLYFTQANTQLLTVLDSKTGKPLLAGERLPGVNQFYASPVAAAGRLYLVDRQGTTLVLSAGDRPEVLATNRLSDPVDASPAVAGRQLFLRGERFLYCIEAAE